MNNIEEQRDQVKRLLKKLCALWVEKYSIAAIIPGNGFDLAFHCNAGKWAIQIVKPTTDVRGEPCASYTNIPSASGAEQRQAIQLLSKLEAYLKELKGEENLTDSIVVLERLTTPEDA